MIADPTLLTIINNKKKEGEKRRKEGEE